MVIKERTGKTIQVTFFTEEDKQRFKDLSKNKGFSGNQYLRHLAYSVLNDKGE